MDDTTDSSSGERQTVEKRVMITVRDYPVPVVEDDREIGLEALEDAINDQLGNDIDPASITATTGHHFTEIDDECPRCGGTLELRDYTYCNGGAVAEANCINAPDCEWRGQAVYRLVDLAGGAVKDGESAVTTGEVTPTYIPYETDP
jgi:hypothetical protein